MTNGKIALFDFCGTIVNFQTADAYVNFTTRLFSTRISQFRSFFYKVLSKLGVVDFLTKKFPKASINKRLILWKIRGLSKSDLDESARRFYVEEIKPNFIRKTVDILHSLQADGYRIVVVSGGYDLYLKYFASEYEISDLFSTKIAFRNNRCLGRFDGNDCMWEEKTEILNRTFDRKTIQKSIAFSDSISDLPMLHWADEAVVVSRGDGHLWSQKYGFTDLTY